jgi:hypothetical protein
METIKKMKKFLDDPTARIMLDDFVSEKTREFIQAVSLPNFPVEGIEPSKERFLERIQKYEEILKEMQSIVILLARWGDESQVLLLEKIFARIAESDKGDNGKVFWLRFGWYPTLVLMYSAGIAALSAHKYSTLSAIFNTSVLVRPHDQRRLPLVAAVPMNLAEISDAYKWLPEQQRNHTPRSRHMRDLLRSEMEEILFLGKSYEELFDEFETYMALACFCSSGRDWFPVGIFAWKYRREEDTSPFHRIMKVSDERKDQWVPLQAGVFGCTYATFKEFAEKFKENLDKLDFF